MSKVITLNNFILERQKDFDYATGELTNLLNDIVVASKIINRDVNRAGLIDIIGKIGNTNIQGEEQQKLDAIADEILIHYFKTGGEVCGIASEENDGFVSFDSETSKSGKYVVLFDPLDGSSNIDINAPIGTIFSVFRRVSSPGTPAVLEDFLQKGTKQVAAGYVLYGSSTMLVYTTGKGVNGFTLDPSIGEFCLSHPNIKTPETGEIYSINEGNLNRLTDEGLTDYIKYCRENDKASGRPYSGRYIGALVGDFHRNMIKGGIYIYPTTKNRPEGRLRLLYECNPLAFIAEQSGAMATDGYQRILEIEPKMLHQRCGFFVGSKLMVEKSMSCLKNKIKVTV